MNALFLDLESWAFCTVCLLSNFSFDLKHIDIKEMDFSERRLSYRVEDASLSIEEPGSFHVLASDKRA